MITKQSYNWNKAQIRKAALAANSALVAITEARDTLLGIYHNNFDPNFLEVENAEISLERAMEKARDASNDLNRFQIDKRIF